MRLTRAVLASSKGRIVLAALACYLLWQGWLTVRAPGKLVPGLSRVGADPVDVVVTLPFPPSASKGIFDVNRHFEPKLILKVMQRYPELFADLAPIPAAAAIGPGFVFKP